MKPAKSNSWKTLPMPEQVAVLDYQAEFSHQEYNCLCQGLIPKDTMENQWFVYFEHHKLHLHRSWTGYCIYEVTLREHEGWHVVERAVANRHPDQYNQTDDSYDLRVLDFVIGSQLLGYEQLFPQAGRAGSGGSDARPARGDEARETRATCTGQERKRPW